MTQHDEDEWLVEGSAVVWDDFEDRLAAYLATMGHIEDELVLETPGSEGPGAAPYVRVGVVRPGVLRAELSGNGVLEEIHRLDVLRLRGVFRLGWEAPDHDHGFPNYHTEVEVDEADVLARRIRLALGDQFGITAPALLSHRARGPAAEGVDALGISPSEGVPVDTVPARRPAAAVVPESRDELVELLGAALAETLGRDVERDDDDDFVLEGGGHLFYARVRADEPTIEVFTRVVHDVDSATRAAVEVALLNRDVRWAKFHLDEGSVFMTLTLPGSPYSAEHVVMLVPWFSRTLLQIRDDLALRTGGSVG